MRVFLLTFFFVKWRDLFYIRFYLPECGVLQHFENVHACSHLSSFLVLSVPLASASRPLPRCPRRARAVR